MKALRAALYLRVSSDKQDVRNSIDRQTHACRAWAKAHNVTVLADHVYKDEAITGSTLLGRPGLQRLLDHLKKRRVPVPFDVVLVDEDSRLDRGGQLATLVEMFQARGIKLIAVDNGRDLTAEGERLMVHVKAGLNAHQLDELGRRTREGLAQKFRDGFWAGGSCYGYRLIPEWPEGVPPERRTAENRIGTRVEIDPDQALVIKELFRSYATGATLAELARRLNDRGLRSPRGGTWDLTAIRAMLHNPKYRGAWAWNESRWKKKPDSLLDADERAQVRAAGRSLRHRTENSEEATIRFVRPELRIVADAVWNAVAAKFDARKGQKPKPGAMASPLSGLIRCACGGSVVRVGGTPDARRLGCSWAARRGKSVCANRHSVIEGNLIDALFDHFEKTILKPGQIERAAKELTKELARRKGKPAADRVENLKKQIATVEAQVQRLLTAVADGIATKGKDGISTAAARMGIEPRLVKIEKLKKDLKAAELETGGITIQTPATVKKALLALRADLKAGGDRSRDALRRLVAEIVITGKAGAWDMQIRTRPWVVGTEGASELVYRGSGGPL